jgi:IS605 OrfB family transposase
MPSALARGKCPGISPSGRRSVAPDVAIDALSANFCIVMENLEHVREGKIRRHVEQSQWSFYQLLQFILYKAALRGVMVIEADPAYTSQECSLCHQLTKPNGKKFVCGKCGHNDHRDANGAFSLAERVMPIGGIVGDSVRSDSGLLVAPFLGTEVQQCT